MLRLSAHECARWITRIRDATTPDALVALAKRLEGDFPDDEATPTLAATARAKAGRLQQRYRG